MTSITAGAGLSGGTITSTGTISLTSPIALSFLSNASPATGQLPYVQGTALAWLTAGVNGQFLFQTGGIPGWNTLLSDNGTILAYTGTGGDTAPSFNASGVAGGGVQLGQGTTPTSLLVNSIGLFAPASVGTAYAEVLPGTGPAASSVLVFGAVSGSPNLGTATFAGVSGTGNVAFTTSPTFTTPALGTPASGTLTNATGLPLNGVVSPTGAVATIAQGNNPVTINSAQTSNTQSAFTFGETSAATGGSGNNELNIATAANSTSTDLNITQGAISTVFPNAVINIAQGANTGATNVPVLNFTSTWNNASLAGPLIKGALTNTSSVALSPMVQLSAGVGGATNEFQVLTNGEVQTNNGLEMTAVALSLSVCGGQCTANSNAIAGGNLVQGSDNSNTGAATGGGYMIVRGGFLTGAANAAALPGVTQLGDGFFKATVANVGDVVCATTTAYTVTDCPTTPANNIIGIATNTTAPIGVVTTGKGIVKLDGAATIGDNVCMGTTTAGLAHDNGSTTTACVLGSPIGVVIATAGTYTVMTGSSTGSVALSNSGTFLVMVQLHISQ